MFSKPLYRAVVAVITFSLVFLAFSITTLGRANGIPLQLNQIEAMNRSISDTKTILVTAQTSDENTREVTINPETGVPDGAILLTVFLKHDQSKTVNQILEELEQSGYWTAFPPEGVEVVSWYVVMGLGQVVTLAVPPEKLRAVNVAIERTAWSAYRTEVYLTYDFVQAAQRLRRQPLQPS